MVKVCVSTREMPSMALTCVREHAWSRGSMSSHFQVFSIAGGGKTPAEGRVFGFALALPFSRNASSGAKPASSQLPNESASSEVITCIRRAGHVFHFLRERERGATDERERGATDENASQVSQSALSSIGAWEP